jgi:hypothetical protein
MAFWGQPIATTRRRHAPPHCNQLQPARQPTNSSTTHQSLQTGIMLDIEISTFNQGAPQGLLEQLVRTWVPCR